MNTVSLWALLVPLSEEDITQPEDYDPGIGLFLLIAFLVVAVVVLWLSFRKQLRKTDRNFLGDGSGRGGTIGDSDSAAEDRPSDDGPPARS
jgi:hypothetical protein